MTIDDSQEGQAPAEGESSGREQEQTPTGPATWERRHSFVTVASTIVIATATCLNVGVAYWQWGVSNASAIAAQNAATQAENQAKTAIDTLHASQRSWVTIKDFKIISLDQPTIIPGKPLEPKTPVAFHIEMNVQNTGQSVATDVNVDARTVGDRNNPTQLIWDHICDTPLLRDESRADNLANGFVLVPGENISIKKDLQTSDKNDQIRWFTWDQDDNSLGFTILTCIVYRDTFHIQHRTKSCFLSHKMSAGFPTMARCGWLEEAN